MEARRKTAYLTIDDAPSPDFESKMEFLFERHIPAIFFCVGERVLQNREKIMAAIKKGFWIGNHSFSHPHFSEIPLENCFEEIKKSDDLIEGIYEECGVPRPVKLFRFPYLDKGVPLSYRSVCSDPVLCERKVRLQRYLRELGYINPFEINLKWFSHSGLDRDVDIACTFDQIDYKWTAASDERRIAWEKRLLARIDVDNPEEGLALNCLDTADIIMIHDHAHTTPFFFRLIGRYLEKNISFILPDVEKFYLGSSNPGF